MGEGRVINQITKNLVGVLSNSDNKLEYLVDKNLDNSVSLKGLAEVNTGLPILSVKDVNRVYYDSSNGIKVGFLYKDPGGLLSLNVLQGFWVKTYLKGKEQDGSSTSGSGDKFQLLNLNLLNVSGGLSEISFTTTKPFDEVRMVVLPSVSKYLVDWNSTMRLWGRIPKRLQLTMDTISN